jgi:hypothetical protein
MKKRWLLAILLLALTLRLALLGAAYFSCYPIDCGCDFMERITTPDSVEYCELAWNLATKGQFTIEARPDVFRTPGYPYFLAPWMIVSQGQSVLWMIVPVTIQILLDCLLVLLTYMLGSALFSHRAGLVGALLQAISPLAIAFSCRILSDSIFALLLTAALLMITLYFKAIRPPAGLTDNQAQPSDPKKAISPACKNILVIAAGLLLAMACYVRPIGLTMSMAFLAVIFFYRWRWRQALILAGVLAVCLLPWVWRNATLAGYVGFSDVTGRGLLDYSAADTLASVKGITREQALKELYADAPDQPATAGQMNAYRMRKAREIFLAYPSEFLKAHFKGDLAFGLPGATEVLEVAGLTTGQHGTLQILQTQGLAPAVKNYFGNNTTAMAISIPLCLIDAAKAAGLVLLIIFSIKTFGMGKSGKGNGWPAEVWLIILLVGIAFLMPGVASHPRFRLSAEPILSIAAAVGFLLAGRCFRPKSQPG